jgi:hypothetical protein
MEPSAGHESFWLRGEYLNPRGEKEDTMATDLRDLTRSRGKQDHWLVNDLQKLEAVVGSCFQGVGYVQRKATVIAIRLAARFASGADVNVQLAPDGWLLGPDCSDAPVPEESPAVPLATLISESYKRDYASQQARVALRQRPPEAADKYFEPEDDDTSDISPALARFRQRSEFQLIGV